MLPGTHDSLARPVPEASNVVIATQGITTGKLGVCSFGSIPE